MNKMTDIELINYLLENEITDVKVEPDVIKVKKRNNYIDIVNREGITHNFFIDLFQKTGREYLVFSDYSHAIIIHFKRETKDDE